MPLHPPRGPYAVSTLELELPVPNPLDVEPDRFRLKSSHHHHPARQEDSTKLTPALRLDSLLVTVYYPTTTTNHKASSSSPQPWLGTPKLKVIEGLLKYGGLPRFLAIPAALPAYNVFLAKLPCAHKAPMADPAAVSPSAAATTATTTRGGKGRGFPAAVFSHGLMGTRTMYSQYLCSLASQGMVIAAVEHRDLSGPATNVRVGPTSAAGVRRDRPGGAATAAGAANPSPPTSPASHPNADEKPTTTTTTTSNGSSSSVETRVYTTFDELTGLEAGDESSKLAWRYAQLRLRRLEMREAWTLLQRLQRGEGEDVAREAESLAAAGGGGGGSGGQGRAENGAARTDKLGLSRAELGRWKGRLDLSRGLVLGHSFGGATAIECLREADTPFLHGLVLDPWAEPLPKPGSPHHAPLSKPLYVLNSDAFTVWRGHFDDVRNLVAEARRNYRRVERERLARHDDAGRGGAASSRGAADGEGREGAGPEDRPTSTGSVIGGWLLTLSGTKHTDFSDFPFLLPRLFSHSKQGLAAVDAMRVYAAASWAQVEALHSEQHHQDGGHRSVDDAGGEAEGAGGDDDDEALEQAQLRRLLAALEGPLSAIHRRGQAGRGDGQGRDRTDAEEVAPPPVRRERAEELRERNLARGRAGVVLWHPLDEAQRAWRDQSLGLAP